MMPAPALLHPGLFSTEILNFFLEAPSGVSLILCSELTNLVSLVHLPRLSFYLSRNTQHAITFLTHSTVNCFPLSSGVSPSKNGTAFFAQCSADG